MRKILFCIAGITVLTASPAFSSCYGTGYSRYCNGIGGSSATYSPRGNNGSTTYYNRNGGVSRTQIYSTSPGIGGGYTRQTNTYYYGR